MNYRLISIAVLFAALFAASPAQAQFAVSGNGVTLPVSVANGGTGTAVAPTSGQILVGNAGGTAYAPVSMSGDVTITNLGVATVAASAVTLQKAYNGGAAIVVTAANPASIANATNVTGDVLKLQNLNLATNSDKGIAYTRTGAPTGATTYTGNAFSISNTPTGTNSFTENGVLLNISHVPVAGAGTITDTTTGFAVAMTPAAATSAVVGGTITMGANATGNALTLTHNNASATALAVLSIVQAANTGADGALKAALTIDSQATLGRVIDCAVANTGQATGIWTLRWRAATTLAAATTMLNLDGNTNVTGGSQAFSGLVVKTAAAITNASYCGKFDFRGTAGTAAGNGIVNVEVGASTTLTGQLVGIECDLSTNVTPGANACIGQRILIPATTRADTAGEAAVLAVNSTATSMRMIDLAIANTSTANGIWIMRWGTGTTLASTSIGVVLDMSTNLTLNNKQVIGHQCIIGAGASASSIAFYCDWQGTAGTTNGVFLAQSSVSTTLTGQYIIAKLDGATNIVPGAISIVPLYAIVGATTRADTALEGAIVIDSTATRQRAIDCAISNTGAATGLVVVRWRGVTTLSAATTMLKLDGSTNVTATGQVLTGISIVLPSTATATSSAISITNNGSGPAINLNAQSTPDTLTTGNLWHDSTQKVLNGTLDGLTQAFVGCNATQTTTVTQTNTSLNSLVGTVIGGGVTLPANFFVTGKSVKVTVMGKYSSQVTPGNIKITVQLGATDIALNAASALTGSQTNQFFKIEAVLTCRTTGGSGVIMGVGYAVIDAGLVPSVVGLPDQTATINTAASQVLDVKWQFDTASNSVSAQIVTVEVLNDLFYEFGWDHLDLDGGVDLRFGTVETYALSA